MAEQIEQLCDQMVLGFEESEPDKVKEAVSKALAEGADAKLILDEGLKRGLDHLGELFERQIVFIPQIMFGAKIFADAMEILRPHLVSGAETEKIGTAILGTVQGDLHDLGKNMVAFMLSVSGFQVIDLGINITADSFVQAVRTHKPDILGLSSLLTTTMLEQRHVIEYLIEAGIRQNVLVMVGGAPVSERWAREIGADGYAGDATRAVAVAKSLLKSSGRTVQREGESV
jgi:corrinoid protein of di/trimethylamine methyltransferase